MKTIPIFSRACPPSNQRGIALLVSLIILVVMTLAGIALVRSIDTGVLAAGNLAFRQGATHAGQKGIETARTWLMSQVPADLTTPPTGLYTSQPGNGFYATDQRTTDLTGNDNDPATTPLNWDDTSAVKCLPKDGQGNTICYVIHRLCSLEGPPPTSVGSDPNQGCSSMPGGTVSSSGQGALRQMTAYQKGGITVDSAMAYYFRITVRVAGPRNTFAYVQAFVVI